MGEIYDVSVIVPFYNGDVDLLKKCIDSIYNNAHISFEVIIVNDGSDYYYKSLLDSLVEGRKDIRIIHKKNGGVSLARNTGVNEARGGYIAFVDADDIVLNQFVDEAFSIAKRTHSDLVIGKIYRGKLLSNDIKSSNHIVSNIHKTVLTNHMISYKKLCHFRDGTYIGRGPWARLIRTDLAKQYPFDETIQIGEDCLWNIQLIKSARKVTLVNKTWYFYREVSSSTSNMLDIYAYKKYSVFLKNIMQVIDLSNCDLYRRFVELYIEDLKNIHKKGLYISKLCRGSIAKKEQIKVRQEVYENMLFDEIYKSSFFKKLVFLDKVQLMLFKDKKLFAFFDVFRDARKLKEIIKCYLRVS